MADGDLGNYGALNQDGPQDGIYGEEVMAGGKPMSLRESLPQMMYGFGDDESPLPETVACMEQLVCEYVRHVTDEACKAADVKGKLDTDCFVFAVRNDKAKFKRMKEIIGISSHITNATRMRFSDVETAVFQPTFPAPPRKIAVASIPLLAPSEPADSLPVLDPVGPKRRAL